MDDRDSSDFIIRIDDESPDSVLQEDSKSKEIKKVNLKIMLSTLFVLCLVAGFLFFAYREIEKKTVQIQKTGISEVEILSKALETRFASISAKNIELEALFSKKILSLEQKISSMQTAIKKKGTEIKRLEALKVETKELARRLDKLGESVDSIRKDLEKISTAIKTRERKVDAKLSGLSEMINNVKRALKKTRSEFSSLASEVITKEMLDKALENDRNYFRLKINQIAADMEGNFSEIRKKINGIDNRAKKTPALKEPSSINNSVVEEDIK
jgi:DNA repair exonuclease SbcCD ATPase subunit